MNEELTRRVLEGSRTEVRGEERQSATARRRGSGSFLRKEDLNLDMAGSCIRERLKVVEEMDILFDDSIGIFSNT